MRLDVSLNPLGEREVCVRESGIREFAAIETELHSHGLVLADFEAIDASNNRMVRLAIRRPLPALRTLLCAGSLIESIQIGSSISGAKGTLAPSTVSDLSIFNAASAPRRTNTPNLETLSLANNVIDSFAEVAKISSSCPRLQFLSLQGNPVTSKSDASIIELERRHRVFNLKPTRLPPAVFAIQSL
jgi:hypothetical protein